MRGRVFTKWLSKLRRLDFAAGWFFIGLVAGIAQLVEHLICNQAVVGSNPTAGFSLRWMTRASAFSSFMPFLKKRLFPLRLPVADGCP